MFALVCATDPLAVSITRALESPLSSTIGPSPLGPVGAAVNPLGWLISASARTEYMAAALLPYWSLISGTDHFWSPLRGAYPSRRLPPRSMRTSAGPGTRRVRGAAEPRRQPW